MISPQAKQFIAKGVVYQTNNWNGFMLRCSFLLIIIGTSDIAQLFSLHIQFLVNYYETTLNKL